MKAWIAMAFGGVDNPYGDEPSRAYAYDGMVQNHKQVHVGDLLFLRNQASLEGVARINRIDEDQGEKAFQKCPICSVGRMHLRKNLRPSYKCNAGHEFDTPQCTFKTVRTFKAWFIDDWVSATTNITVDELRPFELRDSKQLAIMPAEIDELCQYVGRRCTTIADRIASWKDSATKYGR